MKEAIGTWLRAVAAGLALVCGPASAQPSHIGGCDDLMALDADGGLVPLLDAKA